MRKVGVGFMFGEISKDDKDQPVVRSLRCMFKREPTKGELR